MEGVPSQPSTNLHLLLQFWPLGFKVDLQPSFPLDLKVCLVARLLLEVVEHSLVLSLDFKVNKSPSEPSANQDLKDPLHPLCQARGHSSKPSTLGWKHLDPNHLLILVRLFALNNLSNIYCDP